MKLTVSDFCPLIQAPCKQLGCSWFQHVHGMHPQTGEQIDEWRCAMAWLPMLLVENSRQTSQAGAAIESFRNEVAKGQRDASLGIAPAHSVPEQKQIEAAE